MPQIPKYFVQFVGHINERIRPEFFPPEVKINMVLTFGTQEELKNFVNTFASSFVRQQCMIALKDPEAILTEDVSFDKRMIVPIQMIAWIDCSAKLITGEVPGFEEGKTILQSGRPVQLN